ncbi:MAG: efflux transporter periplasmic adaptor subunit, partial [Pseudomonadota bacterium]
MRFFRQSLVGVFLTCLTLGLLVYAGQIFFGAIRAEMEREARIPQPRERVFAVNVVTAEYQTVEPELEAFGQIQSRRTLELRAASSGRVVRLEPEFVEGGNVSSGDVLVEIDPADAQAALDRVESDLMDAEAEVRDAVRELDLARDELTAAEDQSALRDRALQRQQDLTRRGVGTTAAEETAELSAVSARQAVFSRRMSVSQAEGRVDQAATRLAR